MRLVLVMVTAFGLMGCATLFGEKNRSIKVETEPTGADVFLNGLAKGKSPATVTIEDMLAGNVIEVRKSGYEGVSEIVSTSIQPMAFLNLLQLQACIIGWGVDLLSGDIYKIDSQQMHFNLVKAAPSPGAAGT